MPSRYENESDKVVHLCLDFLPVVLKPAKREIALMLFGFGLTLFDIVFDYYVAISNIIDAKVFSMLSLDSLKFYAFELKLN